MQNTPSIRSLLSVRTAVLAAVPWFLCSLTSNPAEAAGPGEAPVVGGEVAKPGEWPDVVAVLMENGSLCSGTLLQADLVLTAAHCVEGVPREVIIGDVDLAQPAGERRAVKWSKAYPSWMEQYDVGVVMLENPVSVKPRAVVQGCSAASFQRGTKVELVGFGQTTMTATDRNTKLHEASLVVDDAACMEESCASAIAPGGEFIAGGNGTDACFGDSGGPVYLPTAKGPALIGVVSRGLASFGQPCGDGGVFVRADKVVSWIERVTGRTIERAACDVPADGEDGAAATDSGGCSAGGAGAAGGGLAAGCALLCAWGTRRRRGGDRVTTRRTWPRSR